MPALETKGTAAPGTSDPIAGVIWTTIAMAMFAGLAVFARAAMNAGLHPFVVVFLRNLFAVAMLLPLLAWRGRGLLHSPQIGLYGWRVAISLFSMLAWFYALALIPVGEVMAIGFLAPLFGTLGAIFLLGERVRVRRWAALIVGFAGAMIILRPGVSPLGPGQVCAVLSAVATGVTAVLIKQLTARDDPDKIVFLTNVMLMPLSLVPALFVWRWPTLGNGAAADGHGAVRGAGSRRAGARLCGHRRLAGADVRVLASAVHGGARLRRLRGDHRPMDVDRRAHHFRICDLHHAARGAAEATARGIVRPVGRLSLLRPRCLQEHLHAHKR